MFQQGQFIIIRKVGEKMGKCHELSAMNYWISQKIIFKFIGNGFGRYAKGVPCSYEFKRQLNFVVLSLELLLWGCSSVGRAYDF